MSSDDEELEVFLGKISDKERKSRKISRRTVLYIPGFRNKYLGAVNYDSISDEPILSEDEMESEDSLFVVNPDNVNEDSGVDCSRDSRCPDSSRDSRCSDSSHDPKCPDLSRDSRCADSTMESLSSTVDLNIARMQESTFDLEAEMQIAISDIEESTTDSCSMLNQGLLDFGSKLSMSGDFESSTMSRKDEPDLESNSGKRVSGKCLEVPDIVEDSKSISSIETKNLKNRKLKRKIAISKKSSESKLSEKGKFSPDDDDENKENCPIDLSARAVSENQQNEQNEIVPAMRKVSVKKSQYFNDENLKLLSTPVTNKFDTAKLRNKHLQTDLLVLSSPVFISPKTKCSRMETNITVRSDTYPDRMPISMVTRNLSKSSAFSTYKSPSASKSKILLTDSRENEIVKLYSPRGNKKYFSPLSESTPKVDYSEKKNSGKKYFSPLANSQKETKVQLDIEPMDVYADVKGKMMPPLNSVSIENVASQVVSAGISPVVLHPTENDNDGNNLQSSQESNFNQTPSKSKLCSFCQKRETDVQGNSTEKATLACTCLESESVCQRLSQLCMDNCNSVKDGTETSAGASLLSIKKAQLEKLRFEKREIEEKIRAAETSDTQTPNSKSVVFCETDPEGSDEAPSMPGSPHPILGRNFRPGRSPKIKDISAISPVVEERALASFEWNQCAGDTYSRGSPHPILGRGHRPRQKRCRPESYSKGRNEISKLFAKIEEHEMKDTAVDTLTKIHTLCNAQRVVEFANVSQLPMVIKHFPPPKEASRIQWSEDLVESVDSHHTPASTPPKTQPILTKRSDGHVFPYNGDAPSPIVITKMRKTNTLGRHCKKPAQHTVM